MYVDSSCEECEDSGQTDSNAANDNSPCGQHTPCTTDERFEYDGSTDQASCVACDAGKRKAALSHFDAACEGV